ISTTVDPANARALYTTSARNASQVLGVVTDPLGKATSYTLDTQGRATQTQTPDGAIWSTPRDFAGNVTTVTDPFSRTTKYDYSYGSGLGDLTQITFPDGSTQKYQYDGTYHLPTVTIDPLGNLTSMAYDGGTGELTSILTPTGERTTLTWSGGLLESVRVL